MKKTLIALSSAAMLVLSGCEGTAPVREEDAPAPKAEAPMPSEKPSLTDAAKAALAQARADAKEAKSKKALWTTVQDELKNAESAAAEFDSQAVIKHAKTASEHARLGIEQTKYPLTNVAAPK